MTQEAFVQTVAAHEEYLKRFARPSIPITNPNFVYRSAAQTDVQKTWRRFGWQPKSLPTLDEITKAALKILDQEIQNANQR